MKKTLTTLSLLLLLFSTTAHAKDGLQQFCSRYTMQEDASYHKIPKILLAFVPKDRETRVLLRCLRSIHIFQMSCPDTRRSAIVGELEATLAQDNFESLLKVTDHGTRVNIYINQDEKKIRRVLITVDGDDELVVLEAKTRLTFDQFNKEKANLQKLVSYRK